VRQLDSLTPAEIKAAIPMVFPEDGHAEAYELLDAVANQLDSSRSEIPDGYRRNAVLERYLGRVKRALDAIAADGTLIRVGSKERPPDGTSPGDVHYYTPDAFAAAKARSEKREAEALTEKVRWERIAVRLLAADVTLRRDGSLSAESWERLLEVTGL
jgi:hypothetical protein